MVYTIETISELHELGGYDKPKHPLVTVIDYAKVDINNSTDSGSFTCGFYSVGFKSNCNFHYGRQSFDHREGSLHCSAPEQVIRYERKQNAGKTEGWGLHFHPELIRNSALGNKMHEYTFFTYAENEALHASEQEQNTLGAIIKQIEIEYNTNIDYYSHDLIISNIELLLNYCKRYYNRQFITRTDQNKDVLVRFETFMLEYFNSDKIKKFGIPSVKYCAEAMHLSPNYFSDLLKSETGKNTQEHIHFRLLEKAKTLLIQSNQPIHEIAFNLGFEYPQNFSKLFKNKIGVSPALYRAEGDSTNIR
jgi:AraC-like DNA-binding protein